MLEAVLNTLCTALTERQIPAVRAFPDVRLMSPAPAVAVGVKKAAVRRGGLDSYLGENDAGSVYALLCDTQFALDIYVEPSGGAEAVSAEADRLTEAIWDMAGAAGPESFSLGETVYDRGTDRLLCRCTLGARFWLIRDTAKEPELTKFTVKGMILNGGD